MGNQKGCIFCVDDQHDVCLLIATVLRNLGYDVQTAYNFTDGLRKVIANCFDLYIINSELPDGTGSELCKQIRLSDTQSPIIFTSGCDTAIERVAAYNSGANYFLPQPFAILELEAIVARLLYN